MYILRWALLYCSLAGAVWSKYGCHLVPTSVATCTPEYPGIEIQTKSARFTSFKEEKTDHFV